MSAELTVVGRSRGTSGSSRISEPTTLTLVAPQLASDLAQGRVVHAAPRRAQRSSSSQVNLRFVMSIALIGILTAAAAVLVAIAVTRF